MKHFKTQIKRHVTLLEVLIAMALTSIILVTVLYFYQDVILIGAEIDRTRVQEFYSRYVENRLFNTISQAVGKKDVAKDFAFFSFQDETLAKPGSQSLIFTFNNGFSMDKSFSNHVVGRLYVDKNGKLTLAYWPSPKRWDKERPLPMKKEILMEGVDTMTFEFFIAPAKSTTVAPTKEASDDTKATNQQGDAKGQQKAPAEKPKTEGAEASAPGPEPKGSWTQQLWAKEFDQLPVMVKVIVTLNESSKHKEKQKIVFAVPLVKSDAHVVYD